MSGLDTLPPGVADIQPGYDVATRRSARRIYSGPVERSAVRAQHHHHHRRRHHRHHRHV